MKFYSPWAVLPLALLAASACTDVPTAHETQSPRLSLSEVGGPIGVVPNEYIVVFNDDVVNPVEESRRLLQEVEGAVWLDGFSLGFKGFAAEIPEDKLAQVIGDGSVREVIPNEIWEELSMGADGILPVSFSIQSAGSQEDAPWWLDRIDQRTADLDGEYHYPGTGAGVYVYMIGTGIRYTHEEFGGRAFSGVDLGSTPNDGLDCWGVGTARAGVIGSSTYGVAKEVTIVSARIGTTPCGSQWSSAQLLAAIEWIIKERLENMDRPMVVSTLISCPVTMQSPILYAEALEVLIDLGVPVTAMAGVYGQDACTFNPSSRPDFITVGATLADDARADDSGWGSCLDLFAPTPTRVPYYISDTAVANVLSSELKTAFATDVVVGAIAVYLEKNPTATPVQVKQWLIENATAGVVGDAGTGSPNRLLYLPSSPPATDVSIVVRPGEGDAPVNLKSSGQLAIALLTSDDFDPATLDLSSVRLGDDAGSGSGTPIRRRPNGTLHVGWEDVDGDGRADLVLHFAIPELVANGDLSAETSALVLTGQTSGGVSIRGEAAIRVIV